MGSGLGPRAKSRKPKMCFTIAVVHLKPHLDAGHSKHWSKSAFSCVLHVFAKLWHGFKMQLQNLGWPQCLFGGREGRKRVFCKTCFKRLFNQETYQVQNLLVMCLSPWIIWCALHLWASGLPQLLPEVCLVCFLWRALLCPQFLRTAKVEGVG